MFSEKFDIILQVNGKYVANKEQTENLFAETNNSVTILVSRCLYQVFIYFALHL